MNKIVAIAGMCGSGKSIATVLLEERGYQKVYFGGVTLNKLKEENLEITPANERMMQKRLREEHGMGAYAVLLLPKIDELSKEGNVVIDGLYSWDELKILNDRFGERIKLIAIICDKDIRYERLASREVRPFTKEEAIKRDVAEIENVAKGGPIAYADYYIDNNGSLEQYQKTLKKILSKIEGE